MHKVSVLLKNGSQNEEVVTVQQKMLSNAEKKLLEGKTN